VSAVFVRGRGADRVVVGAVGIGVRYRARIAGHRLHGTIAPGDRPGGNRVRSWIAGRQSQRVGCAFVDRSRTTEGQGRRHVVDGNRNGVAGAIGAVLVGGCGTDGVTARAVGIAVGDRTWVPRH